MPPYRRLIDPFHDQPKVCWFCREEGSLQTSHLNAMSKEDSSYQARPAAICSNCVFNLASMAEMARKYNVIHRGSQDWNAVERLIQRAMRHECGTALQKSAITDIILRVIRRACVVIAGNMPIPEPIQIDLVGEKSIACVNLLLIAATAVGINCIPTIASDVVSGAAWSAICRRAGNDPPFAAASGMLVVLDGRGGARDPECSVVYLLETDYGLPGEYETIYVD